MVLFVNSLEGEKQIFQHLHVSQRAFRLSLYLYEGPPCNEWKKNQTKTNPVTKHADNGTSQKNRSLVTVCLVHLWGKNNPQWFPRTSDHLLCTRHSVLITAQLASFGFTSDLQHTAHQAAWYRPAGTLSSHLSWDACVFNIRYELLILILCDYRKQEEPERHSPGKCFKVLHQLTCFQTTAWNGLYWQLKKGKKDHFECTELRAGL